MSTDIGAVGAGLVSTIGTVAIVGIAAHTINRTADRMTYGSARSPRRSGKGRKSSGSIFNY